MGWGPILPGQITVTLYSIGMISEQDNPHAEIPKGKNSKFFKLCQTLKMPYRLRKQDTNDKGKRRRSDRLIPVSRDLPL